MKDVLDKQKERAIETLKQMSEEEKDIMKKKVKDAAQVTGLSC